MPSFLYIPSKYYGVQLCKKHNQRLFGIFLGDMAYDDTFTRPLSLLVPGAADFPAGYPDVAKVMLIAEWRGRYVESLTVSYGIAAAKEHPELNFEELLKTANRE
jgi:hypothetical protein